MDSTGIMVLIGYGQLRNIGQDMDRKGIQNRIWIVQGYRRGYCMDSKERKERQDMDSTRYRIGYGQQRDIGEGRIWIVQVYWIGYEQYSDVGQNMDSRGIMVWIGYGQQRDKGEGMVWIVERYRYRIGYAQNSDVGQDMDSRGIYSSQNRI